MHRISAFTLSAIIVCFYSINLMAGVPTADTTVNGMKVELHVLPAEPFFTKEQVTAGKAKEGMVVVRGAEPLAPDAITKPNRHIIIHLYDSLTSKPILSAKVKMTLHALDEKGELTGIPIDVPVVEMQSIGMGEGSTHYGNNVVMQNTPYLVDIEVNGSKLKFKIGRLFGPASTVEPASSGTTMPQY
jgi:hypothetical protein